MQKIKERCQKCKKKNFKARNEDFCSEKCSGESEMEKDSEEASSSTEATSSESESGETTTVKARRGGGKKRNNKDKEERKRLRENRKRNRARKNNSKNSHNKNKGQKFALDSLVDEDDIVIVKENVNKKIGPLESFIKFLFKKN